MVTFFKNNRLLFMTTIILSIVLLVSLGMYKSMEKNIVLAVDGKETNVKTMKRTVEELLNEQGIKLDKEDYINVDINDRLNDDLKIQIKKAVPVTVEVGKKNLEIKTVEETVRGVLKSLNIDFDENDKISPKLDTKIKSGLTLSVVKVEEKTRVEKEEIPYETITKKNDEMDKGKTKVVQNGETGVKEIKIKEIYEEGKLVSKKVISEDVTKNPVSKIIQRGTKDYFVASNRGDTKRDTSSEEETEETSSGEITNYKRKLTMTASAYDLSYESCGKYPSHPEYGITASGTKARDGVVAVDPDVIPLGTKLYVKSLDGTPDYGYAVAEDTGGAIKGDRIDLFINDPEKVQAYGLREVEVYILE